MSDARSYGVVEVNGLHLGIETSALMEAVEWPTDLQAHPTAHGLLLGVFRLRGNIVPLVDLRGLFFAKDAAMSGPTPLVAVIRYNGACLGIAIDGVCEIVNASKGGQCTLTAGDGSTGLLPTLLTTRDADRLVYVLDLAYLAGLPDVIFAAQSEPDRKGSARVARGVLRHYLVFECDARYFCIDASVVTELVDKPEVSASEFGNERCVGVTDVREKKIAVLSLSHILGFESEPAAVKKQLLLLTAPDGRVSGFGYDRMVAIRRHDPDTLTAVPAYGLREPDLLGGVMDLGEGEQALLLVHQNLLERPDVKNYARIYQHEVVSAQETHQTAKAVQRQTCLLFHAPIHFSAPLNQISEILDVPEQLIPVLQPESHLLGQFNLRGEQVPLICLSSLIESSPQSPTPSSKVLIVRGNHSTYGFAVCKVDGIDSFKEFDPSHLSRGYNTNTGKTKSINDRVRSLVSIGNSEQSWRATLLDLHSLAVQLEGHRDTPANAAVG